MGGTYIRTADHTRFWQGLGYTRRRVHWRYCRVFCTELLGENLLFGSNLTPCYPGNEKYHPKYSLHLPQPHCTTGQCRPYPLPTYMGLRLKRYIPEVGNVYIRGVYVRGYSWSFRGEQLLRLESGVYAGSDGVNIASTAARA